VSKTTLAKFDVVSVFIACGPANFVLSYFDHCTCCNKCLIVHGFKTSHSASSGYWLNVVLGWFSGSIVCIHCGQKIDISGL
jgi:hypothetical protein